MVIQASSCSPWQLQVISCVHPGQEPSLGPDDSPITRLSWQENLADWVSSELQKEAEAGPPLRPPA